jgi:V/A-type H+-transporting ATPase subunit D
MSDITPTRSAWLELREEREGMQEGYRFLDEKRLVLAAEILQQLKQYETLLSKYRAAYNEAARALRRAVVRQGLIGLEHYPPLDCALTLQEQNRSVLGVELREVEATRECQPPPEPHPLTSPEADKCRERFAQLLPILAQVAAVAGNLERLREEYRRTARRARALEDVLLPEIAEALERIDTALEELEKEEAVRVKMMRRSGM